MSLFDKYSKLRKALSSGRLITDREEMLKLLIGELTKEDIPVLIAEPATAVELRAVLTYAKEKNQKVAVASGLQSTNVRGLGGQILILTSRFCSAPVFSPNNRCVKVEAGFPVESLDIDLKRNGVRWHPLLPTPQHESIGAMIATGQEGLRNWTRGGMLGHIQAIEWMAYDGTTYHTGPAIASATHPDVSGFLFDSCGKLGIILSVELSLEPAPAERTAILLGFNDPVQAQEIMGTLKLLDPQPETVVYWGECATQMLRQANDESIPENAKVLIVAEWGTRVDLPESLTRFGRQVSELADLNTLWQDLLRMPRTMARLHPHRTEARLHLPGEALADMEERALALGRDANLCVVIWGTVEAGYIHLSVLQPDDEPRTNRTAEDLMEKLLEDGLRLGGTPTGPLPKAFLRRLDLRKEDLEPATSLRATMLDKCDPGKLFTLLHGD